MIRAGTPNENGPSIRISIRDSITMVNALTPRQAPLCRVLNLPLTAHFGLAG
jgi:hypothetical protein